MSSIPASTYSSIPPRVIETIESLSKIIGAGLDRKMIAVIIDLLDAGVNAESISDVILELRSAALMERQQLFR